MTSHPRVVLRSPDPDTTRDIAEALSTVLQPGDVLSLTGELGAGKTCFVQGAARGLGFEDRVTSPTFLLVKEYPARIPIVHCDVYRLDNLSDVRDLGDAVMGPDGVTFLEWGDAVAPLLPDDRLEVELLIDAEDDGDGSPEDEEAYLAADRLVRVTAFGAWEDRLGGLRDACSAWVDDHAEPTPAPGGTV